MGTRSTAWHLGQRQRLPARVSFSWKAAWHELQMSGIVTAYPCRERNNTQSFVNPLAGHDKHPFAPVLITSCQR
jgi:hypothetical protein